MNKDSEKTRIGQSANTVSWQIEENCWSILGKWYYNSNNGITYHIQLENA